MAFFCHIYSFILVLLTAGQASSGTLRVCGTSDFTIGDLKFSGNSMRARHNPFLYHGTILYNFPLRFNSALSQGARFCRGCPAIAMAAIITFSWRICQFRQRLFGRQ